MTFQSRQGLMLAVVICSMAHFAASFHSHQNAILTDAYLRGIMDRLGDKVLPDSPVPDGYVDYQNYDDVLGSASISDPIESEIKEYEEAPDNINEPRERSGLGLSLRDQEYLKHSSLLASNGLHQHEQSAGSEKGTNGLGSTPSTSSATTGKSENVLPAYCNPPNPCPIGYTAEDGCLEEFENTAAFSREYQASQDCMCDTEHMFDCPASSLGNAKGRASAKNRAAANMVDSAIRKIMSDLQSDNPYLQGDKLPIAAKKGNRVA